jgi:hypothetical protein
LQVVHSTTISTDLERFVHDHSAGLQFVALLATERNLE